MRTVFVLLGIMLFALGPACLAQEDLIPVASKNLEAPESSVEQPAWGMTIVALIMGGFLFLFLEIAVIPGFGLAGIIGLLMLITGLVFAFLKLSLAMAGLATFGAGVGLIALLIWFFCYFPNTRMGQAFVLSEESSVEDGCIAIQDLKQYVGKEGITQTMLRPSGIALVDGEKLDVISDCEFIEKGVAIKITKLKNGRLLVVPKEV
jgi:membrane-bound ClpP family serine protease